MLANDRKPLITVIVPIYNGELFLETCIQSVLEQSYQHWELLLIDDGSTDSSAKICERYATFDSRICALNLPHGGVSIARNAGLTYGHGDYFFFLDSDDFIHPRALETELCLMQTFGCAFAGMLFANVEADARMPEQPDPITPEYRYLTHTELCDLFGNFGSYELGAIGGKMLTRSAVEGLCFSESLVYGEDTLFLLDVIARSEISAVILAEMCYFRRLHQNSTTYCKTFETKMHFVEACLRLRTRYFELYGTPGCWERICVHHVFYWYDAARTGPNPDPHADELRRRLQDLLNDDYACFLPLRQKITAELYLFNPAVYGALKKFYWHIHRLLTGKGDPRAEK